MKLLGIISVGFNITDQLLIRFPAFIRYLRRIVCISKHISDNFPIQNDLKQDALLPLIFNFSLEYAIKKVHDNQVEMKLNGTYQLLAYADDMN
jgi:hypothetical protein